MNLRGPSRKEPLLAMITISYTFNTYYIMVEPPVHQDDSTFIEMVGSPLDQDWGGGTTPKPR